MELNELVQLIVQRLEKSKAELKNFFLNSNKEVGVRYCYLDDLLPDSIAREIYNRFPTKEKMRFMSSFREKKYTSKKFDDFDPLLRDITFAIQDQKVIRVVEEITDIVHQKPDPSLYAGGLSLMEKGNYLNPHIDNSHELTRTLYRTLNLLYYVNPDWKLDSGGNLELWDKSVKKQVTIISKFNRLVIMETNPWSWHSVSPVTADQNRICVSNYYFSPTSPIGEEYFNVTSFSARPEQKLRRIYSYLDKHLRNFVRIIIPRGLGKVDVYQNKNQK
ncbi:2OG-Fe(II) oxygenase [Leptospira idonii]|uniref:2OG-Fe(II) oxygenase n=1 Tax=Leptospira idonii TaxID=1193500 RepID=A0A4V3JY66_9LEPT|nr:2OG-Fe(II) oxygenase [Leptospira idonii]TGN18796.1 2OG-Fe(II) oxygenase [Leptospira idonii]